MKLKFVFAFALALLVAGNVFGQKENQKQKRQPSISEEFEQMERRFAEMQRRMMEQFKNGSSSDFFSMPFGDSTSSLFKWDTTITFDNGSGSSHFFQFGFPPADSLGGGSPNSFFRQFFDFGQSHDQSGEQPEGSEYLDENGSDDGLLPEERLRQDESNDSKPAEKKKKPAQKLPADKPKSPRKTVRI